MCSLYSQNIQHIMAAFGECQEVTWRCAFFVISQSEYANEVLNLQMRYLICISTTTEHMDNTWVLYYPPTKFATVAHTVLWIFAFLLSANQNKYANEIFIMHLQWWQTQWALLAKKNKAICCTEFLFFAFLALFSPPPPPTSGPN